MKKVTKKEDLEGIAVDTPVELQVRVPAFRNKNVDFSVRGILASKPNFHGLFSVVYNNPVTNQLESGVYSFAQNDGIARIRGLPHVLDSNCSTHKVFHKLLGLYSEFL